LATGRSLSDEVKKNGPFDEQTSKQYFAQISSAIHYLHKKMRIAHKDLKLANVLICKYKDDQKVIRVTEFSLSRVRVDSKTGIFKDRSASVTLTYMSPQILKHLKAYKLDDRTIFGKTRAYNAFVADIWALGVCLYVMLCRDFPFKLKQEIRLLKNMLDDQNNKRWNIPKDIKTKLSKECLQILYGILEPNPHLRITIDNIIMNTWLKDIFTDSKLSLTKSQLSDET
jgi:serine/threonine protein kinase